MKTSPEVTGPSADEALARLIEGNQRFLRGEARSAAFRRDTLADLALLLASIVPGLPAFDVQAAPHERLSRAVEANARWTVRQILDSPEGQARVAEGKLRIVGAVYEIETGSVRFLRPDDRT